MNENQFNIMLWGPPASGKTWLVNAFRRQIELINKELQKKGLFELEMLDTDTGEPLPNIPLSKQYEPTQAIAVESITFRRKGLGRGPFFEVNTHEHVITLIDAPGGDTTGETLSKILEDGTDEDKARSAERPETVKALIKKSPYIIIMLEAGEIDDINNGTAAEEYLKQLQDLRKLLGSETQRYITFCLTKIDKISRGLEMVASQAVIEAVIKGRFGTKGPAILDEIGKFKKGSQHITTSWCAVSSVGYLNSNNKKVVNWHPEKGLLDQEAWKPVKVELPFFWAFEDIERKRIAQNLVGKSGLLYRLWGFNNAVAKMRAKSYLSYKDLPNVSPDLGLSVAQGEKNSKPEIYG